MSSLVGRNGGPRVLDWKPGRWESTKTQAWCLLAEDRLSRQPLEEQ